MSTNLRRAFYIILASALTLSACTKKQEGATPAAGTSAKREVNLAIWGNYLRSDQIQKFEQQTGIKVNVSNYTSNEELLAKVQAGAGGIDVAVPSDYMVSIMTKLDLLAPLDKTKIPNAQNLSADLLGQSFDPENKYSLPYAWSTAGIAVNRELYKGEVKSWKDFFEKPDLAGKISLLDDVRESMAAALKYQGTTVNATRGEDLKKAEETLKKAKARIKMFRSDTLDALLKKEIAAAHSYSTDALQAVRDSGGKIEFILPEEGGTRAIDTVVIFKSAKNQAEALELINFMLSSDVNVAFVQNVMGGPVLKDTKEKLPETLKANKALFPPAEQMKKFEALQDLGENTRLYDEIWTRVKTE